MFCDDWIELDILSPYGKIVLCYFVFLVYTYGQVELP